MTNSRNYKRLSLILAPSPPLSAVSHGKPRPVAPDSVPINHQEGSHPLPVKNPRQSLQTFSPAPTMHPLLSGPTTSDLPLIVFSQTCSGSGPLMSQPLPRGRSYTSHNLHPQSHTTSVREKQTTELPKPKCRSPDLFLPSAAEPKKHPRVLRNRRGVKHRASVDVTSATGWIMPADDDGTKQVATSPNRSLWTHKRGQTSVGGGVWDREPSLSPVEPLQVPLPEKQRVMNVRRAKKMQQVFGSELPPSLFQITHAAPVPDENDIVDGFDDRASVSTLFSASTLNLQSSKHRRVSTSSPVTPTTPALPSLEVQEPALPRFEQSFTRNWRAASPPFSHAVRSYTHKTVAGDETHKPTPRSEKSMRRKEKEFKRRRMRAAKLSKFFGVDYHDLEPHLVPGEDHVEVPKVEVAIDDRGALPWDRPEFRSLEMEDVIVRLRDLRSS